MNRTKNLGTLFSTAGKARVAALPAAGFTLLEVMLVAAIGSVMALLALPVINTTMSNMHLGAAASSLSSGIQAARYLAISSGCPVQIAVSAQTYQVSAQSLTGTPPACNGTFAAIAAGSPLGGTITYASSEISLSPSTTVYLYLSSAGTLEQVATSGTVPSPVVPTPYSFILGQSVGAGTKTVSVSGVGYVKVM